MVSLGGSVVAPDGVNRSFVRRFATFIRHFVKRGDRFVIVVGGGAAARRYQDVVRRLGVRDEVSLDWIGIYATRLNAAVLRSVFHPRCRLQVDFERLRDELRRAPVVVAAGATPGHSTDHAAISAAVSIGSHRVIKVSDVRYVYDRDPDRYPNARPLTTLTWPAYRRIIGGIRHRPGLSVPVNPAAADLAARHGLVVTVCGRNLANVARLLHGTRWVGTTIG